MSYKGYIQGLIGYSLFAVSQEIKGKKEGQVFSMTRGEILSCLDACFGVSGSDVVTRWCKCILLCDWLLVHDSEADRQDKYVARVCYTKFLLGLSKIDVNDDIVTLDDRVPNILTASSARSNLGLSRMEAQDITKAESIVLKVYADVSNANLLESIESLDMGNVSRREYKRSLRESLLEIEDEDIEDDVIKL